jgi:hypothetical protein
MSKRKRPAQLPITPPATSRDHDIHKGAVEDEQPSGATNAPALDANGLPKDRTTIAANALGAREDETQG